MGQEERILLVNLGTTGEPTAERVEAFLREFLSDPMVVDYPPWLWRPILGMILRSRPVRVAEQYRAIWTDEGSPLEVGTRRLAEALRAESTLSVDFAYRYGQPSLRKALEELPGEPGSLTLVPLFPQWTGSTTGTIEALAREVSDVSLMPIPPDEPGYIEALADRFRRAVGDSKPEHFVVSFHGIPARYDRAEGGRYRRDCETTYRALLKRIEWPEERATLAYQSRFGPEPWLRPATATVLEELPAAGVRSVAVATPGFLTEGLETLEEIGIRGRSSFLSAGGERFVRVPCVEAHPALVASLAERLSDRRQAALEESV